MLPRLSSYAFIIATGLVVGCTSPRERARADSAQALAAQQGLLLQKLTAQRDSVSRVLGDADDFIGKIDNTISRVKGLPPRSREVSNGEGSLESQVKRRKELLRRVEALVARAQETARQVAALKDRERLLLAENGALKDSLSAEAKRIEADARQIAELQGTIDQQAHTIAEMQARLDDFDRQLASERTAAARAYYVVGTKDELIKKGVVVEEGGTNLLIKRFGRTIVPARELNKDVFTAIDTRSVHEIDLPDST
jgi:chromosome segregation ATPase